MTCEHAYASRPTSLDRARARQWWPTGHGINGEDTALSNLGAMEKTVRRALCTLPPQPSTPSSFRGPTCVMLKPFVAISLANNETGRNGVRPH